MHAAIANNDADAYLDIYGEDAMFVRHQTGTDMGKAQFSDLMASDDMKMGERRCV